MKDDDDNSFSIGPNAATCSGFDRLINNVNHMTCTRNSECDTGNCTITALPYNGHTISMKLLSCRQPRPGVRLIARNPRGQLLLDRVIDESQSNIELSSNTHLNLTLDQLTDSIGLAVSCLTFSTPVQQGLQYILVLYVCQWT